MDDATVAEARPDRTTRLQSPPRWRWWGYVGIALGYAALSRLGLALRLPPSGVATFWPAAGLGAAVLAFSGRRDRPRLIAALFVGCVLGDLGVDPIAANLGYAVANCAESLLFAVAMLRCHEVWHARRATTAARVPVMLVVALAACTASGVLGSLVTGLAYDVPWWSSMRTWVFANLAGIVLAMPIATHVGVGYRMPRRARAELVGVVVLLTAVTVLLFAGPTESHMREVHYLVLPPLLWAAIRVGPRESAWATGVLGWFLLVGTAEGYGPWSIPDGVDDTHMFGAQVFVIALTITTMSVARATDDRRRAAARQLETERALADRELEVATLAAERERERLEAQLLQSQRLEALGRLAGGVAHDFNNLLGVIRNYAALISRDHAAPEALRIDAAHIEHAAGRGAELTRELLLFSRGDPEGGGTADAAEVARTVVRMLSRSLGATIDLRLATAGTTIAAINAARLEQALINLVLNSRDAIAGAGCIDVIVTGGADRVTVAVADTGAGMPADVVAHAFEPFFTTKAPGEGSGLGLSTVYGIVERAGGRVRVDSAPGRGTTVTIELLAAVGAPTTADAEIVVDDAAVDIDSECDDDGVVVVVDDDVELLGLTVRLLEAEGIDAVGYSDAGELLRACGRARTAPAVLVTDVVMAGTTGPQLAAAMWERHPDLPVVFVSGFAPPQVAALDDPRAAFVAKPVDPARLAAVVRAQRRRPRGAAVDPARR